MEGVQTKKPSMGEVQIFFWNNALSVASQFTGRVFASVSVLRVNPVVA